MSAVPNGGALKYDTPRRVPLKIRAGEFYFSGLSGEGVQGVGSYPPPPSVIRVPLKIFRAERICKFRFHDFGRSVSVPGSTTKLSWYFGFGCCKIRGQPRVFSLAM